MAKVGFPDYYRPVTVTATAMEQLYGTVTDEDTVFEFSEPVTSFFVYNKGRQVVFFNKDAPATINHQPLLPTAGIGVDVNCKEVHCICRPGETTEVNIIGVR